MAALKRVVAAGLGVALAAAPAVVAAQAETSRALDTADDFWKVLLLTALGIGALLLVASIGYLYRRERNLAWEFQRPDPGEDDGEDHD